MGAKWYNRRGSAIDIYKIRNISYKFYHHFGYYLFSSVVGNSITFAHTLRIWVVTFAFIILWSFSSLLLFCSRATTIYSKTALEFYNDNYIVVKFRLTAMSLYKQFTLINMISFQDNYIWREREFYSYSKYLQRSSYPSKHFEVSFSHHQWIIIAIGSSFFK